MLPDDHEAMIELFLTELCSHVTPRGVVHVGAHQGEEFAAYTRHGIRRIVAVEANPRWAAFLRERSPDIDVIEAAVSDRDGQAELLIHTSRSGSEEPASLLPLGEFGDIVPSLRTDRSETVRAVRLDTLYADGELAGCDFLNIDIQGAELQALQGAELFLREACAVLTETNVIEMYAGGATEAEIDSFLTARGFSLALRVHHELYRGEHNFPAWGESLYVRLPA